MPNSKPMSCVAGALRRARWVGFALTWAVLSAGARPAAAQAAPAEESDEPLGAYLDALVQAGRMPGEPATTERLRQVLEEAEALFARGDARAATAVLFGVVESRRFEPLRDTPSYQNAEFLLGRALARGRAFRGAERYLGRVVARGTSQPYFVPAYRAMVDLALETARFAAVAARLDALAPPDTLPEDSRDERAYLSGRAVWGDGPRADAAFASVSPRSRLFPAALYFRGLIAVRQGELDGARKAFCRIADQRARDRLTFNVDHRFFRLKDMARLALGRIAHERGRYDEAYLHYFAIPEESERLNAALFEASWSMLQKGQFVAARAFAEQFDRLFPRSPLRPEVALLRANLAVKTCQFDGARTEATALVSRYQPLSALASRVRTDEAARRHLLLRLMDGQAGQGDDLEGQLVQVLALDDDFRERLAMLSELEVDRAEALVSVETWRALGALAETARTRQPPTASVEAVVVLEDTQRLLAQAPPDPDLVSRLTALARDASSLAYPMAEAGPYASEARKARDTLTALDELRAQTLHSLRESLRVAVADADERLRNILAKTRLVHIDAVVGKKKKLELEIAGLAEGRLPAALFYKMQAEGTLADDEIYWPFEGEEWADEYENYR